MDKEIKDYSVLLINPPYPGKNADPSISLGYLASVIKDAGWRVYIWDEEAEYFYKEKVSAIMGLIQRLKIDLVGFTLTTPFVRFAYNLADIIKSRFDIPIIAGGTHATLCPKEVLERSAFEAAVIGEGEQTVLDLIGSFRGNKGLKGVPGIAYKDAQGNVIINERRPPIQNLDTLPFCLESQAILDDNKGGRFAQIVTSRGCPGKCIFCGSLALGKQFRFRSAENIFEEVLSLHEKYGITHFRFRDDAMTINRKNFEKICGLFIAHRNLKFTWTCASRVDGLDSSLLNTMKDAGCVFIDLGMETASDRIMKEIKKNISIGKVREAIENCDLINLPVGINLMSGFPFETKEDIKCNMDFVKPLVNKKNIMLNVGLVLRPYPGTQIYDVYHKRFGFTEWWLDRGRSIAVSEDYTPLYLSSSLGSWTLPEDPVLELDFFKYSPEVRKAIKRFIRYKCLFSMKKCYGKVKLAAILFLYYLSKYLYKINPYLERSTLRNLFMFVLRLKRVGSGAGKLKNLAGQL